MEIKKPIFRHFLLFFNVFSIIFGLFGLKSTFCGPQAAGVPIVMILSQDDPGLYKKPDASDDPMYETFVKALESHQNLIVSSPMLYWLTKRTNEHRGSLYDWAAKLQNEYALFVTKDEGFALIVPKARINNLPAMGINPEYLSEPLTSGASIKQRFADPKLCHQDVCPEQIDHLFIKNSFFHQAPPKYWYITGHGLDSIDDAKFEWCKASIAEMPAHSLANLLEVLNGKNTRSVYLLSCYSAGSNALNIQNILAGTAKDERCLSLDALDYPVIFQCSCDIVACPIMEHFDQFFTAIEEWDCEDPTSVDCLAQKLSDQFMQANPTIKRLANYPMIRLPKDYHFQALPLPSTLILSEPIKEAQTIEAPETKEMIQIYPADLMQMTLHLPDPQLPFILSRIPGRSHHFIGSIAMEANGKLPEVIQGLFLTGVMIDGDQDYYCGVSDKAWFIEKLKIANKEEIQGLAILKGSLKHGSRQAIAAYRTAKNEYFRITMRLPVTQNTPQQELIDEATYVQILREIYWQTMPEADALYEALHQSESQSDHDALLIAFGKKLSISLSAPSDDEMIQKDFNQIKSGRINKAKYINYAAHIHHESLIDAIVDHGMSHDIFDTDDIILLLFKLIEHEYQSLIFKQVKKLAAESDPQILFCVENVFRHCLDVGLYKHALQMYDDLFCCLKKVLSRDHYKKDLLAAIQKQLMRFVMILVQHDCAPSAVEKVVELLNSSDLGLQAIGLILFATIEDAGYTNEKLNQKRTLLHAIALNLKKAAQSHNTIALYFYEQALVQQCIDCLTSRAN